MMKYVYFLFSLVLSFQVTAQTDYTKAERLVKEFAYRCATPSRMQEFLERGRGLTATHQLDSVVTENGNGVVTSRSEMAYNANGTTSMVRDYERDSLTGELVFTGLTTLEYDGGLNPTFLALDEYNDTTQTFERQLEMEIFYNGADRIDSLVISTFDIFTGEFGPLVATKNVYTGDLLTFTQQWFYLGLLGLWIPASQTEFTYDNEDRLTVEVTSLVDFQTLEVIPDSKTEYTYINGNTETETTFAWTGLDWEPSARSLYAYFGNGGLSELIHQVYSVNDWVNESRTVYAIEDVTDQFPYTGFVWDTVGGQWIKADSTINLLNPALLWENVNSPSQLGVLLGVDAQSVGFLSLDGAVIDEGKYFVFDVPSQSFVLENRDLYYYSLIEGSQVIDVLPEYLSVSPNPSQGQFAIRLESDIRTDYTVFTLAGQLMTRGEMVTGTNTVPTTGWASGIYVLLLRQADGMTYVHRQVVE